MHSLLKYFIKVAQRQYFDKIRDKIDSLRAELFLESTDSLVIFKIALLEYGILPEERIALYIPDALSPPMLKLSSAGMT